MVDTATARFGARKQSIGSNVNTWGDTKLNEVIDLIDRGAKGYQAVAMTGDVTLNWTSYQSTNQGQVQTLKLTGALSGAANLIVPSREWNFTVINATGQTVTVKTSAGVGVSIPTGYQAALYCDGTDVANAAPTVLGGSVRVSGRLGNLTAAAEGTDAVNKAQMDASIALATTSTSPGTLRVTASDTTAKFLDGAISVSGALTKSVLGPGGNEALNIAYQRRAVQPVPLAASFTCQVGGLQTLSTAAGALTAHLPPATSVVDGDWVDLVDVGFALETNNAVVNGNGKNIKFQDQAAASTLSWVGPNGGRLWAVWDASADQWLMSGV
jgi:hypothetical protein